MPERLAGLHRGRGREERVGAHVGGVRNVRAFRVGLDNDPLLGGQGREDEELAFRREALAECRAEYGHRIGRRFAGDPAADAIDSAADGPEEQPCDTSLYLSSALVDANSTCEQFVRAAALSNISPYGVPVMVFDGRFPLDEFDVEVD